MKIYIAGPMRGIKNYNFPAFLNAHAALLSLEYEVENPAYMDLRSGLVLAFHDDPECAFLFDTEDLDVGDPVWNDYRFVPRGEFNFNEAMRRDIEVLTSCDGIAMLPGWQDSEGAKMEHHVATKVLGLPAYDYDPDHPAGMTLQKGESWQERTISTKARKN